jgi:hypothetical protein
MEMKFKFDNKETLTLDVFDTETNRRVLELCKECKTNNVGVYQRQVVPEIGRSSTGHWLAKPSNDALDNVRKGFEYTGIEPAFTISNSLTIEECNVIHRQFTTSIAERKIDGNRKYDRAHLSLINHGIHDYEDSLVTPNYMKIQPTVGEDYILGFEVDDSVQNMSKYTFNIRDEHGNMSADVYLNDECRVGRSFEEAWIQDDNPSNSDIMNIDAVGPIFLFQNERRKKLYSSDSFRSWIEKYNITEKEYADIPFANIVDGNYGNAITGNLIEITC